MNAFDNFLDGLLDKSKILAKDELKNLISEAKNDASEFVRLQAGNFERWTEMLAKGDLSREGYKNLVDPAMKMWTLR
jgi:hypothetical protein